MEPDFGFNSFSLTKDFKGYLNSIAPHVVPSLFLTVICFIIRFVKFVIVLLTQYTIANPSTSHVNQLLNSSRYSGYKSFVYIHIFIHTHHEQPSPFEIHAPFKAPGELLQIRSGS